jgi:hypothetical protein
MEFVVEFEVNVTAKPQWRQATQSTSSAEQIEQSKAAVRA